MTRRHFLPLAAPAPAGTAALGYYAWNRAALIADRRREDEPVRPLPLDVLPADARQILFLASLAPSSHNTQPWSVRRRAPYRWVVGIDPAR